MAFDGRKVILDTREHNSLSTSWGSSDDGSTNFRAVPQNFLIPVYHKIRIPVHLVHDTVFTFNSLLEPLREHKIIASDGPFEWDIQLNTVNNLKTKLREEQLLQQDLFARYPFARDARFIWTATALVGNKPVLSLLFDATDVARVSFSSGLSSTIQTLEMQYMPMQKQWVRRTSLRFASAGLESL